MTFLPSGWYSLTQAILILLGAFLAFTGGDKRMRWPAGAMVLSLVSARLATALPDYTVLLAAISALVCGLIALRGQNNSARVIAATYLPRLVCYGAYAVGAIPLWFMWEASNAFLWIQIAALYVGAVAGGHMAGDLLVGRGGARRDGVSGAVPGGQTAGRGALDNPAGHR